MLKIPLGWLKRRSVLVSRHSARSNFGYHPRLEILEDRFLLTTVTNLNDDGSGSLRQAIAITPRGGLVNFAANLTGTLTLALGNLAIGKDLTISGPGPQFITISGNSRFQVFNVPSGVNVTIAGLTITSGVSGFINGAPNSLGGGVFNAGTLSLINCVISSNIAQATPGSIGFGGGVFNLGNLTMTNCLVFNNQAQPNGTVSGQGGGVYNTRTMTMVNVTVASNNAGLGAGVADITSSTIHATADLVNCTIANNVATQGGGLVVGANTTANLRNTLIASNLAQNGPDISGNVASAVNNLVRNADGSTGVNNNQNGNLVGSGGAPVEPRLGTLQFNGGLMQTLALLPGSPAIDAGTNSGAPTTDVRGFNRPVNGTTDIGSYEFQQPATTLSLAVSPNPGSTGQAVHFQASVRGIAANSNIPFGTVTFFDGSTPLATVNLDGSGNASFSRNGFTLGTHFVSATYNGGSQGDFVFNSTSSGTVTLTINPLVYFAVGGIPGVVDLFNSRDGSLVTQFLPFPGYFGRINVALGKIRNATDKDLVVAASDGNPQVKVYNGQAIANGSFNPASPDASLLATFFAYGLQFNIGANVAVGDISDDGFADLVTGATAGNPQVNVYDGRSIANGTFDPNRSLLVSFFAYGLNFNIGANVAVGDVNGDGFADLVTGATAGNPQVNVYNGRTIANGTFDPNASLLTAFFAYGLNFNIGANVAVGDVNGDHFGDVITGASAGNPQVNVFDGRAIAMGTFNSQNPDASLLATFFAFQIGFNIGVTLSTADFEGNGLADILTGAAQGAPNFRVVRGLSSGVRPPAVNGIDFFAPTIMGGISVGA
jgi:hypothetical protein